MTDLTSGVARREAASADEITILPDLLHQGPPTAKHGRRRRRPTGAPPPLPRSLGTSGKTWRALEVALLVWVPAALSIEPVLRFAERADIRFLREVAELRTPWLTDIAVRADRLATGWALTITGGALVVALMVFRRWRHLLTFVVSLFALEFVGGGIYEVFSRPRPNGVSIIGRWGGYSMPSPPVAIASIVLIAAVYTLVPAGPNRDRSKWLVGVLVAGMAGARLYLGVDHPSDIVVGVVLGVGVSVVAFRWFTPNDAFPVTYRHGKTAHLDVTGARGQAIRSAVEDQLGLEVLEVKPVGLAGSGGSTPLRLTVAGDPPTHLFAKLYAMNHVRADRWYKLGRTIVYGRLEDEAPFQSVRRLVGYEDHMLRYLRDAGLPTAAPYGIVEITPEREYMLVTEFLDGAEEIGEADIDDAVIDDGLLLVRKLWDAGVAHRDVKPANLLVRDSKVWLIDVFFVQFRPSPWRQAVDLANMMLVLGVRTDAERVYRKALDHFTPDEIAEAFAATRGVASPSQLRSAMKSDGRDLLAEFRALAPPRRPIAIQRWSLRRVLLAVAVVLAALLSVGQVSQLLRPAHALEVSDTPTCGTGNAMVLIAQSVPSATLLPCVATLPAGWSVGVLHVQRGRTTFSLDSDRAGDRAVEVRFTGPAECRGIADAATEVPSDEAGTRRFASPERVQPSLRSTTTYAFDGGCVTYRFTFKDGAPGALALDASTALAFIERREIAQAVDERSAGVLCGVGVPCPGGSQ
jgi:membrane-associated phospholipid phosphatase/tRNA A-37 threonylcarbamoyl transferase component Bud32